MLRLGRRSFSGFVIRAVGRSQASCSCSTGGIVCHRLVGALPMRMVKSTSHPDSRRTRGGISVWRVTRAFVPSTVGHLAEPAERTRAKRHWIAQSDRAAFSSSAISDEVGLSLQSASFPVSIVGSYSDDLSNFRLKQSGLAVRCVRCASSSARCLGKR